MQSLRDVTGAEFKMFIDFLKSLTLFGDKAPPERLRELIEIIESQADLDAQFDVSVIMGFSLTIPYIEVYFSCFRLQNIAVNQTGQQTGCMC